MKLSEEQRNQILVRRKNFIKELTIFSKGVDWVLKEKGDEEFQEEMNRKFEYLIQKVGNFNVFLERTDFELGYQLADYYSQILEQMYKISVKLPEILESYFMQFKTDIFNIICSEEK